MVALAWRMASTGIAVLENGTFKRKIRRLPGLVHPACSELIKLRILTLFLSDYTFLCKASSQAYLMVERALLDCYLLPVHRQYSQTSI